MNIQAQLCGIILLVTMFLFYRRYKSLRLNTQIAFQVLLYVMLLCVFFDMLSIWAIVKLLLDHRGLVYVICKIYLMTLVLVGFSGLIYEFSDVYEHRKEFLRATFAATAFAMVGIIIIGCLPLGIYKMGRVVYTAGPSVLATYAFTGLFVLTNIIVTIVKRTEGSSRRSQVILIWMGIWALAAVIQFLNNELLLVGYAGALGVLVIFFRLENPEYLTDRLTGLFNQDALLYYARKLYNRETNFAVLSVWWTLGVNQMEEDRREREVMAAFARRLPKLENTKVFKMADDEVWMILEDLEHA
ncbi:MAG: hypothetical protein K2N37_04495, partial [Lachnospiraceae bacterium]|nr:hypothetical protein [Lachnospiraceae bacterium]